MPGSDLALAAIAARHRRSEVIPTLCAQACTMNWPCDAARLAEALAEARGLAELTARMVDTERAARLAAEAGQAALVEALWNEHSLYQGPTPRTLHLGCAVCRILSDLAPAATAYTERIRREAVEAERERLKQAIRDLLDRSPSGPIKRAEIVDALLTPCTHTPISYDRTPNGWRCSMCGQIVPEAPDAK